MKEQKEKTYRVYVDDGIEDWCKNPLSKSFNLLKDAKNYLSANFEVGDYVVWIERQSGTKRKRIDIDRAHGGKRGGAGRPKGTAKEPTKVAGVRLPMDLAETHKINSEWLLDAVMQKIEKGGG